MNESIKVKVTRHRGRKYLIMYYDDPATGKREQRSTKETTKTKAERAAAKWEAELREGRYKPASKITWAEFRQRYEDEVLPSLASKTDAMCGTVFNTLETIISPARLMDLTAERLSYFQSELRRQKKSESTIRTYLAHLKAALAWAVTIGLLPQVPRIVMPRRAKGSKVMKGRPILAEEFDRMLDKVKAVLFPKGYSPKDELASRQRAAVASWKRLLRGLWLSGLRLGEALELYWDRPDKLSVDFDGRRPMFRIQAHLEKGNKDRLLPMTPDFSEFLAATPEAEQTGPVFRPGGVRNHVCRDANYAGKVISKIGEKAGIKVNVSPTGKVKFASAHDLRRSFGARWSTRVMPAVLQQLMRHESIDTTMKFYVGQNAEATADAVWKAAAEKVGTYVGTSENGQESADSESMQTVTK